MGRKKTKEDRQPSSIENWFDLACDDLKKWCNGGDNRRCFILLTSETITPKDSGGDENAESVHLLVTHGHLDHNFGNNTIQEAFGLKPEVSAADENLMKNLKQQAQTFYQMELDYDFPPIDHFFEDDEWIHFGSHQFEIIPTPGHSRGSVTFYCAEEKVAFTGDTLFHNSIGRTDFKGGSMFQIINSLRLLAQLPDNTTVLPGHGNQTTIGEELAHNPYMDR